MKKQIIAVLLCGLVFSMTGYAQDATQPVPDNNVNAASDSSSDPADENSDSSSAAKDEASDDSSASPDTATADEDY